uniref:Collagen alpha-2(VIII) chain-like n=1 Tax=Crassostrea virginica TaxID=6565 RepID=A0A8B8BAX2_CRAVI|nr:collagen alpha-2(VIII) chain-like [Crassostrea virginica]
MSSGTVSLVSVIVCMVLNDCIDADKTHKDFLSSFDSFKNICHKIGWEPKCTTQPIKYCQGKTIAFHAILSKRLTNVQTNTIIKFDRALVNEGNGYDPNTGKFTAPVDGVYSFAWTYHTNRGSNAYLGGYVDGKLTAYVGIKHQSSQWENTSRNLVIKMKKGSQFWIQIFGYIAQVVHEEYSSLLGYKLSGC